MNKTIASIIAITILAAIALFKNIDGIALAAVCTLLAGLGGFTAKGWLDTRKHKPEK